MTGAGMVEIHPFYTENNLRIHEIEVGYKYPRARSWPTSNKPHDEVQLALNTSSYNKYGWLLDRQHVVLDLDVHSPEANGYASKAKLESACGVRLDEIGTAKVTSPSGGCHWYFTKPENVTFPRCFEAYPGLDFIDGSSNKQVVAAGSYHDKYEGRYQLTGNRIAPLPAAMLEHLLSLMKRAEREREERSQFYEDSPGTVFMRSWQGVEHLRREMQNRGYTFREVDGFYEYDRPGKTTNSERSGFLGKQSESGNYHLTSFTLSDPTFPSGQAITIFRAFSLLCCGGDDAEATRQLSSRFNVKQQAKEVFDRIVSGEVAQAELNTGNIIRPRKISEIQTEFSTPRPVLIDGILRRGEIMNLIASPKVGKSWLLNQLLMSLATGADWLGYQCVSGRVLLIDNELHPETHVSRINAARAALRSPHGLLDENLEVIYLRGRQKNIYELAETLAALPPNYYSFIALDAMYRTWPAGTSENSNADVTMFYNALDGYAKLTGAAIGLIHHTSKGDQSEREVTDVGAGAGAISRAADTHITIRPHEDETQAVMDVVCRSFPSPGRQSIRFDFPIWVRSDAQPNLRNQRAVQQAQRDREIDMAVLAFLTNHPNGATVRQIRAATGSRNERIEACLTRLEDNSAVEIIGEQENRNGTVSPIYSLTRTPNEQSNRNFLD